MKRLQIFEISSTSCESTLSILTNNTTIHFDKVLKLIRVRYLEKALVAKTFYTKKKTKKNKS